MSNPAPLPKNTNKVMSCQLDTRTNQNLLIQREITVNHADVLTIHFVMKRLIFAMNACPICVNKNIGKIILP